ncbi:MAG TPA: oxidoreductase [Actinophytocola sp.]|jgi:hypothetical protein|uniref:oxidoreductase n=1 Tax=Actinophytocola sp. TaxID=1872138 RepID=UPI002E020D6B|nr:oxidoreductase [Actinophytocola sp.]
MDPITTLSDPAFEVPPVPDAPRGIAWLRAYVARFSRGTDHARRRALVTAILDPVDPGVLRKRAAELAAGRSADVARAVTVEVLAEALGLAVPADAVITVGRAYHPHLDAAPDTDAAVTTLVEACGGTWDEATAARIGLLVQACDATAALVGNARRRTGDVDTAVAGTLRDDPPVRVTRRVRDGEPVTVDLGGLPFGAGPHACPGRDHAIAIACGILEAGVR